MPLFAAVRFTALICALVVLTPAAHAAPESEVSAAEWGPYGQMVGKSWLGKRDKRNYRVTVEWQEPGKELVEKWIDLDARFANVARNITNTIQQGTSPGELAIKTLGGRCNRDGRIQGDGSLLLVCRTSLLKWPERLASAGPDALELQTVKLEGDTVTQVVDSVKLTVEPSEAEKRQLIAAQAEPINAADWGVYADLAGHSWATEQDGQQREVSIEWAIPGRELSERWIYKAADGSELSSIISSITRGEKTGELRMVSKMSSCSTRIGQIQSDGSILFTCSGLLKFPLQVAAPKPGVLEHRSVKLENGAIARVSETITYAALATPEEKLAQAAAEAAEARKREEQINAERLAAERGDAAAQYRLAKRYADGDGLAKDPVQAKAWFKQAAEQGLADAQLQMGLAAFGSDANLYAEAVNWLRRAAEQGHAESQNYMGFLYRQGRGGVVQDFAQAARWYRQAAEQGDASAQLSLGSLYRYGEGVEQDDAQALAWYGKAAAQGNRVALYFMGDAYEKGWGGATDIDRAVEFYQQAADKGVPDAQARLGDLYDTGSGVPQDRPKAVSWYRKAAEQGDAYAQRKLGEAYNDGLGVASNQREAAGWFRKAADQGDIYAMNSLGFYYWKDNVAVADQWFRKAIAGGHPSARENLASLHEQVADDAAYREAMVGAIAQGFSEGFTSEWSARQQRMAQQAQQVAEWQAQADQQREQQAQQRADEEARQRAAEMERVRQLHERQEAERQQRAQQQTRQTPQLGSNTAEQSQQQQQQQQQRRADEARRRAEAEAERQRQQQAETERRRQEEAAQRERAERAAQERSRQLEEALKRQEEEARNRPVAYPEGITLCAPPTNGGRAWLCRGPLQNMSGALDSQSGIVAVRQACGGDNIRSLGTVSGYRAYGCGYGIHPTDREYPGNRDIPAELGVGHIPGRGTFYCNPRQVYAYCRERG